MQNHPKTRYTPYDCKYHIVWITKYREKVLGGEVGKRVRGPVRQICKRSDVEIPKGHVSKGRVHLFVSVPPHLVISKLIQYLKGEGSYKLMQGKKQISRFFLGRYLWGGAVLWPPPVTLRTK